ncbi:MAG: long-chain fatty acid--CoA ligase [Bacteroidaceae bacterium]
MEVHHLAVLPEYQAAKYGERDAIRYRNYELDKWVSVSWNRFAELIKKTACALASLETKVEENVGIFSQNKPECLYTELGAYKIRAVCVPLYATSSPAQVQYIVNDANIRHLFVGEQYQYDAAFSVLQVCHSLERLIIFDKAVRKDPRDITSIYFEDLLAECDEIKYNSTVEELANSATPEDRMNILYTSGTTGEPKGVQLYHKGFLQQLKVHRERLHMLSDKDVSMCFLPLTHVFEKAWTYLCLSMGVVVCVNLKPNDIQTSLKEINPTVMCSVPRFWEKVYQGVQEKINSASGLQKSLMKSALKAGKEYNIDYLRIGKKPPFALKLKYQFFERTIIALLKKTLGLENGNFFPTAGAAVPDAVNEFVHSVGLDMLVGYGLTESTATVSCGSPTGYTIGSVGKVMPGLDVKIGENNEILIKGDIVTDGYFRKPTESKEAFTADGYFRTGDAGYFKDGELYLTERIKDLFKTSNGKYIAPQQLETKLVVDRYIDQITIIADQRKFVTALIVPLYPAVKDYAARHNVPYSSMNDLLVHPKIMELFKARIDTLQQQFAHYEQIKRFALLPNPFSMEKGELTNTLKIKRNVVNKNYADIIERMYTD